MLKYIAALIGIIVVGSQVGCSTIVNGTSQAVSISSDPPGARVEVDGNMRGSTPISIDLKRKSNHLVTITLDGYQAEQISINKVISGAVAGNIIAGGFIGWGVDAISGAQYKLKPDTIAVVLRKGETDPSTLARTIDSVSPSDRLRQLKGLHEDELITDEEYEATRKALASELVNGTVGQ